MSPISVHRVYWYTDWLNNVRRAFRDLHEAMFGCQHDVATIRFGYIGEINGLPKGEWATWHVNRCRKCGKTVPVLWWEGRKR